MLLGVNLFILAALTLLTEIYLRWKLDPRYAPRPDFEILHPTTVWAPCPNLHYTYYGPDFSQHIITDPFGCRLDGLGPPGPDDSLLLLVGDSYTFGWGVSGDQTYAAYLDRLLSQARPGWRVVNLGVPGFSLLASAQRLQDYLHTVDRRRVRGVLVLHADNDPVDNVLYLHHKTGFLVRTYPPRSPTSPSRLINLLTRAWRDYTAPEGVGPKTQGPMLWAGVDWGRYEDMDPREIDLPGTKKARHLTPLQARLMRLGIDKIHRALGRDVSIHHLVLYLGPESEVYAPAMIEVFPQDFPAHYHGLMKPGSWDRSVRGHNQHSGGHFTPAYNEHCARVMFDLLQLNAPGR
ncbi:hypothetical protein IV102_16435 [bacterium]|nr:hypothetical protein [bacterium]